MQNSLLSAAGETNEALFANIGGLFDQVRACVCDGLRVRVCVCAMECMCTRVCARDASYGVCN